MKTKSRNPGYWIPSEFKYCMLSKAWMTIKLGWSHFELFLHATIGESYLFNVIILVKIKKIHYLTRQYSSLLKDTMFSTPTKLTLRVFSAQMFEYKYSWTQFREPVPSFLIFWTNIKPTWILPKVNFTTSHQRMNNSLN